VPLHRSETFPLMSVQGQMLLLPHRITDNRFTPISGLWLKLIDLAERCHFQTRAGAAN
jgi:hypothetical protein